jgi:hypothetical protein
MRAAQIRTRAGHEYAVKINADRKEIDSQGHQKSTPAALGKPEKREVSRSQGRMRQEKPD